MGEKGAENSKLKTPRTNREIVKKNPGNHETHAGSGFCFLFFVFFHFFRFFSFFRFLGRYLVFGWGRAKSKGRSKKAPRETTGAFSPH